MSRWNLGWLVGIAVAAGLGLSITYSAPSRDAGLKRKHDNLRLVVDVLDEVQQKYVKELDGDKMRELVENMVTLGLERLDPHSSFINPEEFKQFQGQTKGRFGGIGIRIGVDRSGQIFVESPMVGTPAYEAGIMAGDLVLKIDGHATEGMPLRKVVESIQGDPGTKVTLTVLHLDGKAPVDVDIVRAQIAVDSVLGDQRMRDNLKEWDFWIDADTKLAYVRVTGFTETTTAELTKIVAALQKADMAGLVVDLRDNPGGLLRSAVEVSSLFLPEGKAVVSTKGRDGVAPETLVSKRAGPGVDQTRSYPIAILINRFSASASEIVAAALQDHLRAILIGERSFGKGSVQNVIPMESGKSALKLTTASYWRPSGKNIHRFPESKEGDDWGVRPSDGFEVKLKEGEAGEWRRWRRDRDIVRRPGDPAPKAEAKDGKAVKAAEFRDRVLERALEHLRAEIAKKAEAAPGAPALPNVPRVGAREMPLSAVADRSTSRVVRER